MIIFNYRRNYLVILIAIFIINKCLSLRLQKVSLVNRRAECMKLNVISPRVIGGVLSGGLHAITGRMLYILCSKCKYVKYYM